MKQLYLSQTNQQLSGVCGGIGEYFNVDPTLIRLLWVFATLVTGVIPGVIAYIIAVIVIPRNPKTTTKK